jgi:23S rRNA pseudouridine2605 synthase
MTSDDTTRVNKFIAHSTGLSRREVDEAIASGRVKVNNVRAELGAHIKPTDIVTFDNKPISAQQNYTYLLFNKPVGYVCSRKKQGEHETIYSLLPEQYRLLKPVGRLDRDSSGLLLLTDDGDFAQSMTHPKFYKTKVYEIELDKPLEPLHQQMISDYGVQLEDGPSKLSVEKLDTQQSYRITMHEGRNRQIRRTFDSLGYLVTKLHRTTFGPYTLEDLAPGEHKKTALV